MAANCGFRGCEIWPFAVGLKRLAGYVDSEPEMSEKPRSGEFPQAFGGKAPNAESSTSFDPAGGDLHRCPFCPSDLVYPIDWAPEEHGRWSVSLRCPNCEWRGDGIFDQGVVDHFDETLEHGTAQLLADLNRLSRANAEEAIERFAVALDADQILPEDF